MGRRLGAASDAVARQGHRFLNWMRQNYKWLLPSIILVLMVPILVGTILTLAHVSNQQDEISEQQATINRQQETIHRQQQAVAAIQRQQIEGAYASCERGNETREVNVANLRGDVHTLKTTLALWEAAIATSGTAETPPKVLDAFNSYLDGLRSGITRKQTAVQQTIEAQTEVAIEPGSPVDDCEKVVGTPRP